MRNLTGRAFISLLLLVVFQHFVAVIFDTPQHFIDKVCGLRLKEPSQSDNTFGNRAQVVEQRRRSVRFSEVIDSIRSLVKLSHELWRVGFRLLCFRGNVDVGALGLESPEDCSGLFVASQPSGPYLDSMFNSQAKGSFSHLFRNQPPDLFADLHEVLNIILD